MDSVYSHTETVNEMAKMVRKWCTILRRISTALNIRQARISDKHEDPPVVSLTTKEPRLG